MKLAVCVIAVILVLSQVAGSNAAVKQCTSDSDCGFMECCYKNHDYLQISKKHQGTFEGYPLNNHKRLLHTQGVCKRYYNGGGHTCTKPELQIIS